MSKILSLKGMKFNRLKVVGYLRSDSNGKSIWSCICECGKSVEVRGTALKNGNTKSCGCFLVEHIESVKNKRKSEEATRGSWRAMRSRCRNPKDLSYERYGGAGIDFDDDWNDFYKFLSDMGYRESGLTLDRIDNSKGYSKSNCRWATNSEQSYNSSNSGRFGVSGITLSESGSRWLANIGKEGVNYYLGTFLNFGDAVRARITAEYDLYGYSKTKNLIGMQNED